MKKGLLISLILVFVLALALPVLALTDSQAKELEVLYEQEYQIKQQILNKQEDANLIEADTAVSLRERLTQMWEFRKQQFAEGNYLFGSGNASCHGDGNETGGRMMGQTGRMMW
jgi:hypothetical protein